MITSMPFKGAVGTAAVVLLLSASGEAAARGSCTIANSNAATRTDVDAALASFGPRVLAVGRVDAVSRVAGVKVLGIRIVPSAGENFQVGDYAVVVDWSRRTDRERVLEIRPLSSRYIPGVSEVFLKSKWSTNDVLRGQAKAGGVSIDYTRFALSIARKPTTPESTFVVRGTQPQPSGVLLSSCVSVLRDGSMGTGRVDGSMGTGRMDGSLGTGRTDGSLGTGKTDGSLGTGRLDGSLGTGRTEGSLGTGAH